MIEVNSVDLALSGRPILKNACLTIEPGTITTVLGPNGSGKSSLLKVISGEWKANRGSVELEKRAISSWTAQELGKRRAFLHQETHLDFAFTIRDVVLLGRSPYLKDRETPRDERIAEEALQLVGMAKLASRLYTTLSGGEKQRVQIARVLAQVLGDSSTTKYLILDEPLNNLDPNQTILILKNLRTLKAKNIGILMVLHDFNHSVRFSDRIVLLDDGEIVQEGNPLEVIRSPLLEKAFQVKVHLLEDPESRLPVIAYDSINLP